MALPTREQLAVAAGLKTEYGEPDQVMILVSDQSESDMRMIWWNQRRCLCIEPNGKRRYYEGVQKKIKL